MTSNRCLIYCFVLGTGRCGSTLVHEMLARHPNVGFISNVEDRIPWLQLMGRWNNAIYRRVPSCLTRKGRLRYAPSEGYRALDYQVSPVLSMPLRDLTADDATPWLTQRVRTFFECRAHAQAASVFLHKFTGWPRARFLQQAFPSAKFVHVVRDGRAVANSWLQMPWWRGYQGPSQWQFGPLPPSYEAEWQSSGRSFILLAGLAWKLLMDAFVAAEQGVAADSWVNVRYEDIMADPCQQFTELLQFLELEWTPVFEAAFARHRFDSARSQAFRTDLDGSSLRLLEGSLATHLQRFGYE